MAIATTQLYSRQDALLASGAPKSIDSVSATSAAAVEYTVPANTKIVRLSTDALCLFREGSVAATLPAGATDGEEAAWLASGQDRILRVEPGAKISFLGIAASDALVSIERYVGANSALPPD